MFYSLDFLTSSINDNMKYFYASVFVVTFVASCSDAATKPNIVFVLADDYGYNDIGYHAINHISSIKTPFLDALALGGVKLENYYVQPICSPSRSQLLSGRYQIHTGLQHMVIWPEQQNGLPLDNILLSEQLKNCGYDTHMIGKWHLGFYKEEYLPWKRGFDTYFGFLSGNEDYYTRYKCHELCGYDFDNETGIDNSTIGEYSAHLYARKAGEIINSHNKTKPMFLYLALQSVHTPLQVPDKYMEAYSFIKDSNRRHYAGMVAAMDEAIKNITEHLQNAGMWDNTLLIFSTDNGGQTTAGGNNWPLRGRKITLWEGGVRGVGFVHGKILNVPNPNVITNNEFIHISDWYPTIMSATQCPLMAGTQNLDGYDQWKTISTNSPSPRTELLHNIDPLYQPLYSRPTKNTIRMGFDTNVHAGIRSGDWKLLTGLQGFDKWVEPPESENAPTSSSSNDDNDPESPGYQQFSPKLVQLFNIKYDPYERVEVSELYPQIVDKLLLRLAKYNATAVPVRYPPYDPNSNPKFHGGFWKPWVK